MRLILFLSVFVAVMLGRQVLNENIAFAEDRSVVVDDLDGRIALVEGHVAALAPKDADIEVVLVVDHVFSGNKIKDGDKVTGLTWGKTRDGDSIGGMIFPVPTVGEDGIWVVDLSSAQPELLGNPRYFCRAFPARKDSPRTHHLGRHEFDDGLALAKVVEAVSNADQKQRLSILSDSARSDVPVVSSWSVRSLGQLDIAAVQKLLPGLAKLTRSGQMALDTALDEHDPTWAASDTRNAMLLDAAQHAGSEYEELEVASRLVEVARHPDIPFEKIFKLLDTLASNEKDIPYARIAAVSGFVECSRQFPDRREKIMSRLSEIRHDCNDANLLDRINTAIERIKDGGK